MNENSRPGTNWLGVGPRLLHDRRITVLRAELGERLSGDQPTGGCPAEKCEEAGRGDESAVEDGTTPAQVRDTAKCRDRGHEERGSADGCDGVVPGQVAQSERHAGSSEMVDIVVRRPGDQSADRPAGEEHERSLAHPVGAVEHDHRIEGEENGDQQRERAWEATIRADTEHLYRGAGHEEGRHDHSRVGEFRHRLPDLAEPHGR